jgi:hypothetical protein
MSNQKENRERCGEWAPPKQNEDAYHQEFNNKNR